mgnify:CR=1 FL=1
MREGFVHIYTGDGKGKTTAAVGLAVRAAGSGMRVLIGQFIKASDSSEMRLLRERCSEITIEQYGCGGFVTGKPSPEDVAAARRGRDRIRDAVSSGEFDVVVADEANDAVSARLLDVADLRLWIDSRRPQVELVITGRDAPEGIQALADVVTRMTKVKHPFDRGVQARRGIEF